MIIFAKKPMDYKEIFTASMILFAVIDIIGATPIVISLRESCKIQSEKATIVAMAIMIGSFLLVRKY